ncbi:type VII secretion target [Mycolicibacterium vaccae]|uniref:type VII secretion target n=1 Tax=Mycolicibacterium vaccae TaxID=1810 RepID=UPI003D08D813
MAGTLKVNTDELRSAAASFTAAGERLVTARADAPLGAAAAAVPGLQTGQACLHAQTAVATEMAALAAAARGYGANLHDAATRYEQTDARSGREIRAVQISPPSPH